MGRIARRHLVEEGSTNHCTWRSHNHDLVLDSDEARRTFVELLWKYKEDHGIEIHAYCLMGTHPHVMCRATKGQKAFSDFWKVVNQCFARWYNARTKGRGQVVMERLRSPRIQADGRHQLTVMRYMDLNPVRAGLVKSAKEWAWSSFRHFAYGEDDELITDPPDYLALGPTAAARRKAYLHLFAGAFARALLSRRPDLVVAPFVGDEAWIAARLHSCAAPPD